MGHRTSARKKRREACDASPKLNWLMNITFVATGVHVFKSGDADKTTLWPGAAVTVTDGVVLVLCTWRTGLGSLTLPRRMPFPKLVTQTSFVSYGLKKTRDGKRN